MEKTEKEIQIVKRFLHNNQYNQYNVTITNITNSDKMKGIK